MTTVFLGVDLSLTSTGLAVYDPRLGARDDRDPRTIMTYTLRSSSKLNMMDPARWDQILNQIWPYLDDGEVTDIVAAVEMTFPTIKGNSHDALVALRAVFTYGLQQRGAHVVDVSPGTLKIYATGYGGPASNKAAVFQAVRERYGHIAPVANDDEADALTLLAMTFDAYGWPLVEVDANHRRALKKLVWPTLRNQQWRYPAGIETTLDAMAEYAVTEMQRPTDTD